MCLDSALDLRPPGHFALGFFASRIGRSEMESSALGFGLEACFFIFFFFLFTKYFLPLLIFFREKRASTCEFCKVRDVNKIWK